MSAAARSAGGQERRNFHRQLGRDLLVGRWRLRAGRREDQREDEDASSHCDHRLAAVECHVRSKMPAPAIAALTTRHHLNPTSRELEWPARLCSSHDVAAANAFEETLDVLVAKTDAAARLWRGRSTSA